MKKGLLLIAALFMCSSMLFADGMPKSKLAIGKGKIQVGGSLGMNYNKHKDQDDASMTFGLGDNTMSFMGVSRSFSIYKNLNTLHAGSNGLNVTYGISDEMQVGMVLPLFSYGSMGDNSLSNILGQPNIFFSYTKNMGKFSILASPYISAPFVAMQKGELKAVDETTGTSSTIDIDEDTNFDQPLAFGLNAMIASEGDSKVIWEALLNIHYTLEKDEADATMSMMMGAWGGYKLSNTQSIKGGLIYGTPDLMNDADDAPGFGDGSLNLDLTFSMMLAPNMGLDLNAYYGLPVTDAYEDITAFGLNVGFKMTF